MEKYGLSENTIDTLHQVFKQYRDIKKVILYGSRAKGTYRNGSDIDLCLIAPSWNLNRLLAVEQTIDDLMLPYTIDLSIYHQIDNPLLRAHIDSVGVKFYP